MNKVNQPNRQRELLLCGAIGLVIALVFGSTIYADFVQWDDDINIYRNPSIQGLTTANVQWMLTDVQYVRRYMPLGWLSWAIDYELFELNPAGYHLGNLGWHFLNTLLVFFVLRKVFALGPASRQTSCAFLAAAVGALFWGVHPLRVEPVAWASGRLYCQATALLLFCLFAYLKFVEAGRRNYGWYALGLISYAGSLLTYPIGLGLLPVLVILDHYPLRSFAGVWRHWLDARGRQVWADKIPFVLVAGSVLAITLWCRVHSTGLWRPPVTLETFGLFPRIMQGFYVWGCYLWKTWLPIDLAPLYVTLVNFNPYAPTFVAQVILVVGLTVLFFRRRRQWPAALALWACYLVLLFPMLGFTEHPHYPSDRYSYVAAIPYAAGLALLLQRWLQPGPGGTPDLPRRLRLGCVGLGLFLFAFLSFAQCRIWENSDTMFNHILTTLGRDERRADVHYRLGTYRLSVGNYGGAEESFRQVLMVQPRHLTARAQLGHSLAFQDRMQEAIVLYESVLTEAPEHRETRINLAHALTELGEREKAERHYRELLVQWPRDGHVHLVYAQFLAGDGRVEEAVAQYRETKALLPQLDLAYTELGRLLVAQGDTPQAIQTLREALRRVPNPTAPLTALAWIYATNHDAAYRNAAEAIALAARANTLTRGEHAGVLDTLAAAYAEAQRYGDAVKAAEQALRAATGSAREAGIRNRLQLYVAGRPYREDVTVR